MLTFILKCWSSFAASVLIKEALLDIVDEFECFRLNCGGVAKQYNQWESRCGVCGDDYGLPIPRPHELGGDFGQGIISRNYTENQVGFLIRLKKNIAII